MDKNYCPIAIYDSGLGGLYILEEIIKILPYENIVYFADTKNLPYGDKDEKTILRISKENIATLISSNIKMLIIACNTISVCFSHLINGYNFPIIDMIKPILNSLSLVKSKHLTIIATDATIKSAKYQTLINNLYPQLELTAIACPLFVPAIENQKSEIEISKLIGQYLSFLKNREQSLVLACTHYSALKQNLQKCLGKTLHIIDPATFCAQDVKNTLIKLNLENQALKKPFYQFFVSGSPEKFKANAKKLLSFPIPKVEKLKKSLL